VSAEIARITAQSGAGAFFGLSGSGNFHLIHELKRAGLSYYACTHEAACVAMADGYARTSDKLGVATVHQGPGLTNAATALREAVRSKTPLVVYAAAVPVSQREHNQYLDQVALVHSLGAGTETIAEAQETLATVACSLRRAVEAQCPIVTMIPIDVQEQAIYAGPLAPSAIRAPEPPPPDPALIEEAVAILDDARAPVILAGRGAVRSMAGTSLAELADRLGATLLTSSQAHGLFRGHPRCLGLAGGFGSARAREALARADVVAAFGCSLNPWTLAGNQSLANHARIIQVDVDPESFAVRPTATIAILGDCALVARALSDRLPGDHGALAPAPRHDAGRSGGIQADDDGDRQVIDPRVLTRLLGEMLPAERTLSIDSGHFMIFPASMIEPIDPTGFLLAQGFMSMGLALAEGLGAIVARPDRVGVATLGDGGAKMSISEINTAVRHALPILVVIYNDAAFGAEAHDFADAGRPLDTVRFRDVDFAAVARGFGADGLTVRRPRDLDPVRRWLERRIAPMVVDAKVDPDVRGPWID
jgi:thiamine pyrophosphate-dependent acetolactate synthase large subunit-like protein